MKEMVCSDTIVSKIHFIRGQKVLLDEDLAKLYQVSTKRLNEQVQRNARRFPEDFCFRLTAEEARHLRSQSATSRHGGRRYAPYAFTENGVAMLSGVLHSEIAIEVNILIMRTFTRLRQILLSHQELALKIADLERASKDHEERIDYVLQALKELLSVTGESSNPIIGFRP